MKLLAASLCTAAVLAGCTRSPKDPPANEVGWGQTSAAGAAQTTPGEGGSTAQIPGVGYNGFDRNDYPGDATMAEMHHTFAFTGYWLTNPPGENANSWAGKRSTLRGQGWGFLVLANGRLDKEILDSAKKGVTPVLLGKADAQIAAAAAKSEGFPAGTILFLDQEEGGRMLDEQAAYMLAWTEAVAATQYKPGLYASGQPVPDDGNVTTINDVRERVRAQHLHEIAIFDAQDAVPPSPGCTLAAKKLEASGEPGLVAWQYAQSPGRPEFAKAGMSTYAKDGNCYAPGFGTVFLDMDVAATADPSRAR